MKGLFKKFFPASTEEEQQEFANRLPEGKIGMAKLQGHMLKYYKDYGVCIKNAAELVEKEAVEKEMKMSQWLRHLNMERYTSKFIEANIRSVSDLRHVSFGKL